MRREGGPTYSLLQREVECVFGVAVDADGVSDDDAFLVHACVIT